MVAGSGKERFLPRPPDGYAALEVSRAEILLPLTISNKCGQAFRWRGIKVWEPASVPPENLKQESSESDAALAQNKPLSTSMLIKNEERSLEGAGVEASIAASTPDIESEEPPLKSEVASIKSEDPQTTHLVEQTEWSICLFDRVVLLRQDEEHGYLYHRTVLPKIDAALAESSTRFAKVQEETERWLVDYLNLSVPLDDMYKDWAERDKVFRRFATRFAGIRMLRQDPWECLCAFICSSNNNIARIGQMVQNLCTHFSDPLLSITYPPSPPSTLASAFEADTKPKTSPDVQPVAATITYHPFPSAARLAQPDVEQRLRELGFGYRAKYIAQTAQMLCRDHPQPVQVRLPPVEAEDQPRGTSPSDGASTVVVKDEPVDDSIAVAVLGPAVNTSPRKRGQRNPSAADLQTTYPTTSPRKRQRADIANASDESPASSIPVPPPSIHSVESFLHSLRKMSYQDARAELIKFPGVGPKVADCILLMSMDQPSSIPVDRHVFQFAERWYGIRTKKYEEIAQRFRDLWGEWAGWAHSVIFTADLRSFANYQPSSTKREETPDSVSSLIEAAFPTPASTSSPSRTSSTSTQPGGVGVGLESNETDELEDDRNSVDGAWKRAKKPLKARTSSSSSRGGGITIGIKEEQSAVSAQSSTSISSSQPDGTRIGSLAERVKNRARRR